MFRSFFLTILLNIPSVLSVIVFKPNVRLKNHSRTLFYIISGWLNFFYQNSFLFTGWLNSHTHTHTHTHIWTCDKRLKTHYLWLTYILFNLISSLIIVISEAYYDVGLGASYSWSKITKKSTKFLSFISFSWKSQSFR